MTWTPSSEEGAFNVHKEVEAFLSRHQMHFDLIDWNGETRFLAKQMKAGLEGVPSSLMMIPSFVMLGGCVIAVSKIPNAWNRRGADCG